MKYNLFVDAWEIKRQLRLEGDSRFDHYLFAKAAEAGSGELSDVLRSEFRMEELDIANFTDSNINGTVTSGSANTATISGETWTVNEFTKATGSDPVGFDCEVVLINGSTTAYIADIVSNTADTLTFSSIDGEDVTPAAGWILYIRQKVSGLNDIALKFGIYNFLSNNREALGISSVPQNAREDRTKAYARLAEFVNGIREPIEIRVSESVTFNSSEWQRLSKMNVDPDRVTVTYSGADYYPEQGWEMEYYEGFIRYISSSYSTRLGSDYTVTVTYYYNPRITGIGVWG